jgi:ABC-type lipoprotein release transport system permease subunit
MTLMFAIITGIAFGIAIIIVMIVVSEGWLHRFWRKFFGW